MSVSGPPMSRAVDATASRFWIVLLVRAVVAIVIALVITFSADHSTVVGYLTFGSFALASGVVVAALSAIRLAPGVERSFFIAQGIISVLAGIVALALTGGGIAFLLFLVSTWAAITGMLELYCGIRSRRSFAAGRDWLFAGALTAVFAIVVLIIPADFNDQFVGPDKVQRSLTASTFLVGLLGAYAAILGVYFVISALSLKWGTQRVAAPVAEGGN